jgi:hypothetical protein
MRAVQKACILVNVFGVRIFHQNDGFYPSLAVGALIAGTNF